MRVRGKRKPEPGLAFTSAPRLPDSSASSCLTSPTGAT